MRKFSGCGSEGRIDSRRVAGKEGADGRQMGGTRGASNDLHPQARLKPLNVLGHGRLAEAEFPRCPRDGTGRVDGDQNAQRVDVDCPSKGIDL